MRWELHNVRTVVLGTTDDERQWLSDYLSYSSRRYLPSKHRYEERRVSLLSALDAAFPSGLAGIAARAARDEGYQVDLADERQAPCEPDDQADIGWLRSHPSVQGEVTHQAEAVEAVVRRARGILWLPTASGKTEIAIALSLRLPCRWLFLVHRADLLRQTADRYEARTGLEAGVVGDGRHEVPADCRFVVCSFQTAHRGVDAKPEVRQLVEQWAEGFVVDECHSTSAETYYSTVMRAHTAYYRVGMSATPLARGDGLNVLLVGATGPVVHRARPQELIDLGLLAEPTIRMLSHVHEPSRARTWRAAYGARVVRNEARNALVLEAVRRAEKPALLFVQQVKHGRALEKALEAAGVPARFAWGAKSTAQRRELVTQLERGYCLVLVCNVVFQEGVDIPCLRSVVVASGGRSLIAAVQRLGRGMRADSKTGKDRFEVWDIWDRGCGCAQAARKLPRGAEWMMEAGDDMPGATHKACGWLERHARDRRRAYEREGFEVLVEGAGEQLELVEEKT